MWNLAIHTLVTMVVKNSKTVFSQGNMRKRKEVRKLGRKEGWREGRKKEGREGKRKERKGQRKEGKRKDLPCLIHRIKCR